MGMPLPRLQECPRIKNSESRPRSAAARRSSRESSKKPAKHTERDSWNQVQVFSSARHGRYEEVETALQAGFPPNSADSFGNTLFHVACQNGKRRIAKLAVKYGGRMNAQN